MGIRGETMTNPIPTDKYIPVSVDEFIDPKP